MAIFDKHVAPLVKGGTSTEKRSARLADLDSQIAKLESERADLHASLEEARRHLAGAGHTSGPSDADVAREANEYFRAEAEPMAERVCLCGAARASGFQDHRRQRS